MDTTKTQPLIDRITKACKMIRESDLTEFVHPQVLEELKSGDSRYVNVEFSDRSSEVDACCYLSLRWETFGDLEQRDDGGLWRKYRLSAQLNWPSHGSMSVQSAAKRLEFLSRVSAFASTIDAEVGGDMELCVRTAEEQAEYLAKQTRAMEEARVSRLLEGAADVVRRGMQVGQERYVPAELVPGLKTGNYTIERSDYNGRVERKYVLRFDEKFPDSTYLRRLT